MLLNQFFFLIFEPFFYIFRTYKKTVIFDIIIKKKTLNQKCNIFFLGNIYLTTFWLYRSQIKKKYKRNQLTNISGDEMQHKQEHRSRQHFDRACTMYVELCLNSHRCGNRLKSRGIGQPGRCVGPHWQAVGSPPPRSTVRTCERPPALFWTIYLSFGHLMFLSLIIVTVAVSFLVKVPLNSTFSFALLFSSLTGRDLCKINGFVLMFKICFSGTFLENKEAFISRNPYTHVRYL